MWLFHSFNPFYSLDCINYQLLSFSLLLASTPVKSANVFHFLQRSSPLVKIWSATTFETQGLSISETTECSVSQACLAVWSLRQTISCNCTLHLTLSFSQEDVNGYLIQQCCYQPYVYVYLYWYTVPITSCHMTNDHSFSWMSYY